MSTQIVSIPEKSIWQSRTMLLNMAELAILALTLIEKQASVFHLSDQTLSIISIVSALLAAAVNLYLRPGNVQPVSFTGQGSREVIACVPAPPPATPEVRWRDTGYRDV